VSIRASGCKSSRLAGCRYRLEKASIRHAVPDARRERRFTERMGTATFEVRVITHAEPQRPKDAKPAR
jgi:hypothetical protein